MVFDSAIKTESIQANMICRWRGSSGQLVKAAPGGRKDINYGAGIVIAVATDVTQTEVPMHLNDEEFS